jgi:hypothetical protein
MATATQTMTGQTLAPAAGTSPGTPQGEMSIQDLQKQVSGIYDQLDQRISAIPNVDVAKLYQPLLDAQKAEQPQTAPPWWAQAAAAFGTPNGQTPTIDSKLHEIRTEQDAKDAQIAKIQEAIATASIDQEMQKGNFKKAMEQSRTLQMLKPIIDKYESQIAMTKFKQQETMRQQGRMALATQKAADAKSLLVERAKQLTKGMSIDDRLLMAQVNHIARQQEIALQRSATFDPLSETWSVNNTDMDSIQEQSNTALETWIAAHKSATGGGGGAVTPAPVAGPGKTMTAAERIRAAAGK